MKHLFGLPSVERRRPRKPGPMFCSACGYQLDGLPEPRRPKCGRGFNPADHQTWLPEPPESPARSIGSIILGLTVVAAIAAVVFLIVFILNAALNAL